MKNGQQTMIKLLCIVHTRQGMKYGNDKHDDDADR
jgi:hypothetical protein